MTKKKMLLVSVIGMFSLSIILYKPFWDWLYGFCVKAGNCLFLFNILDSTSALFFLFPSLLFFSLISFFLREEVFRSWLRFSYWWIPVSVVLTLITPEGRGGFFVAMFGREQMAFLLAGLFPIISLILIVKGSLKLRK